MKNKKKEETNIQQLLMRDADFRKQQQANLDNALKAQSVQVQESRKKLEKLSSCYALCDTIGNGNNKLKSTQVQELKKKFKELSSCYEFCSKIVRQMFLNAIKGNDEKIVIGNKPLTDETLKQIKTFDELYSTIDSYFAQADDLHKRMTEGTDAEKAKKLNTKLMDKINLLTQAAEIIAEPITKLIKSIKNQKSATTKQNVENDKTLKQIQIFKKLYNKIADCINKADNLNRHIVQNIKLPRTRGFEMPSFTGKIYKIDFLTQVAEIIAKTITKSINNQKSATTTPYVKKKISVLKNNNRINANNKNEDKYNNKYNNIQNNTKSTMVYKKKIIRGWRK